MSRVKVTGYLRAREWPTLFGYVLFVAVLAAGYYNNLTFVQLGLIDLGTRLVELSRHQVSLWMAALAFVAFLTAIGVGTVPETGVSAPASAQAVQRRARVDCRTEH